MKTNYPKIFNGDEFFYSGIPYFCIESPLNKKDENIANMVYELHIIPTSFGKPIKIINTDTKLSF